MFSKQFPDAGSGAGYDAVATHMILGNANTASVDGGWLMADEREVVDQMLRNIAQITVTPKTLDALLADATAMGVVAASARAMGAVAASSVAMAAVIASTTAMNAVAASAIARDAIGTEGLAYDVVIGSSAARGKIVAGYAGLNPAEYADMDAVAASDTAMAAVVGSASARLFVISSTEIMGDVLASATARHAIWGSDAFLGALLADSAAHDLARAEGALISKFNSGASDLTAGVTGGNLSSSGKYLVLGASLASGGYSVTFATLRSGSAISASTGSLPANANATADFVIPIEGPTLTFTKSGSGEIINYFRILDCTPPA